MELSEDVEVFYNQRRRHTTLGQIGPAMRILAAILPPEAIRKILEDLGLPSRPPPIASAIPVMHETYFS